MTSATAGDTAPPLPRPARGPRSAAVRCAVAALAGLAVWTTFPPLNWWFLAPPAVAAFALAVQGAGKRLSALAGFLFGLAMFVPMLSFLRGLGVDAWFVLAVGESLWFLLLALAIRGVQRRPWWPLALPLLWVAQEFARDRVPFGGFPWGRLGFGQTHGPLLPLAALGGAVGVTLATAILGALLAWLWTARARWRPPVAALAGGLAVLMGGAALVSTPTRGTTNGGPAHAVVAIIQGNVPRLGLGEFAQRRAVTADHVRETEKLAAAVAAGKAPRPDVVVWPENASDDDPLVGVDPGADPVARAMIDRAVAAIGVPVVVGAVLEAPGDHSRNAAIVWSPTTGPGQIYVKRHLVPFGEYLPLGGLLHGLIGQLSLVGNFVPGHRPGVLQAGPVTLADAICFEVADDGVIRDAVVGGGRLIAVQTNNATYEHIGDDGEGGETAQQLEISRLRAVEHGRAVVVAATSGVSAIISPNGNVLARTGVFTPAYRVADLPLRDPRTLADRLGDWPERVLTGLGLLAVLVAVLPRRRERSAPGGSSDDAALVSAPEPISST